MTDESASRRPDDPRLLSIVVPVYNEAVVIETFYRLLRSTIDGLSLATEVWFVNDGSTDRTAEIVKDIAAEDPRVGLIDLSRNFGHQMALTAGMDHARGDLVVCMDGDGQHPPELIPEMLAAHDRGFDVVLTRRKSHGAQLFKRLTSVTFYRVINYLSGTAVVPGAADFRLMSRAAIDALGDTRERHRFLRGLVQWIGYRSTILDFDPPPRVAGESKYTRGKMVGLGVDAILSFSIVPLRISIWLGFILVVLAVAELSYTAILLLSGRGAEMVPGWTSLIFSILGIGGVQLIILGVMGQYIGMIFEQVKDRPLYLLRSEVRFPRPDAALERDREHNE